MIALFPFSDIMDCMGVALKVARVELVPHSNQAMVETPFGLTEPFNVAPLDVTDVAVFVITVGTFGEGGAAKDTDPNNKKVNIYAKILKYVTCMVAPEL
jgi:hypothetical protein